jgi:hypothetical protein
MRAADTSGAAASEMAIVDTFTRLIFGEEDHFDAAELQIVSALRLVDTGMTRDSYREMGSYLRELGVAEMIELVDQVQECLAVTPQPGAAGGLQSPPGEPGTLPQ